MSPIAVKTVKTDDVAIEIFEVKQRGERILDIAPFAMKFNRKTGEYVVTQYTVVSVSV